jgi:hypothetical protein
MKRIGPKYRINSGFCLSKGLQTSQSKNPSGSSKLLARLPGLYCSIKNLLSR